MDVKQGYKQTEVGIIPKDWEVVGVKNLTLRHKQGYYSNERYVFNGTRIVRITDLHGHHIDYPAMPMLNIDQATYNQFKVNRGDFLFARSGAIGRYGIINDDVEAIFGSYIIRFVFDHQRISNEYFGYIYQTDMVWRQLLAITQGSSNININAENIKSLQIPLPSTKIEQEVIAEALTDTDAYIESLEQLIAKKRLIKQGAMQELLTGKRRLPGFQGEWEIKLWGEVIHSCSSGATPYRGRPEFYKGDVKWITSGELNYNVISDTIEHISKEAVIKTNLKLHPPGTFLMAITGLEAAGTRGACGIVGSPATTNQSCMAIYPTSELLTKYLYHYYVYKGEELALKYCQGTKQQSYTAKLVKILPISLPPTVTEQAAIASILSDMDGEITLLEDELLKARQIKQGMMQELLTGRIRLV